MCSCMWDENWNWVWIWDEFDASFLWFSTDFLFEMKEKCQHYPKVVPLISSACELMTSAIKSSLYASSGRFHMRPFRKIGRCCGVRGPNALFTRLSAFGFNFCFNSACRLALGSSETVHDSSYIYFMIEFKTNIE